MTRSRHLIPHWTTALLTPLAAALLAPGAVADSEMDLAVSSKAVTFDYRLRDTLNNTLWGGGAVYNDDYSAFLLSGLFNVVGNATQLDNLYTGLGVKAVFHDAFQSGGALGLGGSLQYQPPETQGFGVEGQLYYAPSALSFNSDSYLDIYARVTYDVHPQARVFVGYALVNVEYDDDFNSEVEFKDGIDLGFTLTF